MMTILRRFVVVIASVIAMVAVGAGVASAGPASSTYRYLCTEDPYPNFCATAQGASNYVVMGMTSSITNWYYPTGSAYTTIRQADTTLCMQLDHADRNRIIEATCGTASYQKWDLTSRSQFRSEYDPSVCLTTPETGGILYVGGCSTTGSWTQTFHALT